MITVGDLKKQLALLSDDLPVIVAEDAEGNSFSLLAEVTEMRYEGEGREIETWDSEDGEYGEDGDPCVVLYRV